MHQKSSMIGVVVLLAAGIAAAQVPHQSATGMAKTSAAKPSAAKPSAAAPSTLSPEQATPKMLPGSAGQSAAITLRPEQMPAVAPRVSYSNGQLTVVAENSSLADIISAIRTTTGVKIETLGGATGERVAARIGPAPVRDVLVSLLDGSRFDYIILGSATQPNLVEHVILTQKTGGANNASPVVVASNPPPVPQQISPDNIGEGDEDGSEGFAEPAPNLAPAQPPAQPAQPPIQQQNGFGQPLGIAQQQPTPAQDQQNVKTPEQLMDELRRMEQERKDQLQGIRPDREDRPK